MSNLKKEPAPRVVLPVRDQPLRVVLLLDNGEPEYRHFKTEDEAEAFHREWMSRALLG